MPLSSISLDRKLTSYARVQRVVGAVVRNRRYQLKRLGGRRYLDLGCGLNTHDGFINADFLWHPGVDLCWDITRGVPLADASLDGIYSEHCLEHFPLKTAAFILRECRRILRPRGILRVIVPDAEIYLSTYARKKAGDNDARFPFDGDVTFEGVSSPILDVNRIFYQDRESPHGHWFIYDFDMLAVMLRRAGFSAVARTSYCQGSDPKLLIDTEARAVESLYVEASA